MKMEAALWDGGAKEQKTWFLDSNGAKSTSSGQQISRLLLCEEQTSVMLDVLIDALELNPN